MQTRTAHLLHSALRALRKPTTYYAMSVANTPLPKGVAVYCGSSRGSEPAYQKAAISVGTALARAGRPLVYGGGKKGIMGIVSETAERQGGQVVGVLPAAMQAAGGEKEKTTKEIQNSTIVPIDREESGKVTTIVVNSMHERKVEMATRAGGFIGLPGGFGTYEEVFEVVTWTQLGIHDKPVVLLNVLGFYGPLRDLVRSGVRAGFIQPSNESLIKFVDGPEDMSKHESFDWGEAALEALGAWSSESKVVFPYDWTKLRSGSMVDKLQNT